MLRVFILIIVFLFMQPSLVHADKEPGQPFTYYYYSPLESKLVIKDTIDNRSSHFVNFLRFHDLPVFNLNVQQGWRTMGVIAFGLCDYSSSLKNLFIRKLSSMEIGSQFNFNPDHFIIGPELSFNYSEFFVNYGGSIIYFTDFHKGTLFFNPHLGLSFNTRFDLYVGYNIPLMHNDMKSLVNHFNVTMAVPLLHRYNTL